MRSSRGESRTSAAAAWAAPRGSRRAAGAGGPPAAAPAARRRRRRAAPSAGAPGGTPAAAAAPPPPCRPDLRPPRRNGVASGCSEAARNEGRMNGMGWVHAKIAVLPVRPHRIVCRLQLIPRQAGGHGSGPTGSCSEWRGCGLAGQSFGCPPASAEGSQWGTEKVFIRSKSAHRSAAP